MKTAQTITTAAVLVAINRALEIQELELPPLKPGQVLVKVAYSGICHSQLLEIHGKKGEDKFLPHTLGHEGSGIVLETGPGVKKVAPGDHVVLTWIKGLGADIPFTAYRRQGTQTVNSGALSTLMSYTVTCENRVVRIDKKMPLKEAALIGCAIPTGVGAVLNTAKVKKDSRIAIFGIGGVGLSALIGAGIAKASQIIAVDIVDEKLERARMLGATHVINVRRDDAKSVIRELTSGVGIDYAIEATGNSQVMEDAFQVVRDKGGLCVLAGNVPYGKRISIDPFNLIKGKRIVGTWGGDTTPDIDIPFYVDLYLSGKLQLKELITHCYPLLEVNQAFQDLEAGKVGRAIIAIE